MKCPGTPEWEPTPARGPTILDWPDPEPLCEAPAPLPYPVDTLPALLRDAVLETQSFVQAPVALVACSALAALSLAGRITALLDMPSPTDAVGGINPVTLDLSPSARVAWIRAHDDIESGRGIGGDYPSLRAGHRTVRGHLWLRRRPSLDHLDS